MSGGSMDYLYFQVLEARFERTTELRRLLGEHLILVAEALRAVEWNDSGDGDDSEDMRIRKVLGDDAA